MAFLYSRNYAREVLMKRTVGIALFTGVCLCVSFVCVYWMGTRFSHDVAIRQVAVMEGEVQLELPTEVVMPLSPGIMHLPCALPFENDFQPPNGEIVDEN
jgi:hypothetical protein